MVSSLASARLGRPASAYSRIEAHRALDHDDDAGVGVRQNGGRRLERPLADRGREREGILALERLPPAQRFVQEHPDRVQVARRSRLLPLDPFGGQVGRTAQQLAGPRERLVRVDPPRDAEVGHLPGAHARVEDVPRLHLPVDDPELVRGRERPQDLEPDVPDPFGRQRAAGELVAERATGEPLHHDERAAVLLAGVEHPTT
jgi:hypothetical protein